jgi:hypothetical protein
VLDRLQLELHLLAQLQVERAERLVEQEHPWLVHERASECDALLLAAGELPWLALLVPERPTSSRIENTRPRTSLLLTPLRRRPKATFSKMAQVREERVRLEDGIHVALVRRPCR